MPALHDGQTPVLPLKSWRVTNFKSVPEANIEFAPLTLLVGSNSSGKSTILQSILLVTQAAQAGAEGSTFPLNGTLTSLGGFRDVVHAFASRKEVSLGGVFSLGEHDAAQLGTAGPRTTLNSAGVRRTPVERLNMSWQISFDSPGMNEPGAAELSRVLVSVKSSTDATRPEAAIAFDLYANRRGQGEISEDAERLRVGRLVWPTRQEFALGYVGEFTGYPPLDYEVGGLYLRAGIPHNVLVPWRLENLAAQAWVEIRTERPIWTGALGPGPRGRYLSMPTASREAGDRGREVVDRWSEIAVDEISRWDLERRETPLSLAAVLAQSTSRIPGEERQLLRALVDELITSVTDSLDMGEPVLAPPEIGAAESLNDVMSELHRFFRERVVYLGPLRQDPQVAYKSAPVGAEGFIGTKGEFLAPVLHTFRLREVLCPLEDGSVEPKRLTEALDYWVQQLDLVDAVQTKDLARLGIQVSVQRGELTDLDLTSVGVGVSQVLPLLVMCLLTPPGSLLLIEQPELHLHPALQQRLGDFLLACARSGRQLLVETHSEHIVSRLRLRVAEDPSDEVLKTICFMFAEQEDGRSNFRPVSVTPFGALEQWPRGFFDQAAEESKRIIERGLGKKVDRISEVVPTSPVLPGEPE